MIKHDDDTEAADASKYAVALLLVVCLAVLLFPISQAKVEGGLPHRIHIGLSLTGLLLAPGLCLLLLIPSRHWDGDLTKLMLAPIITLGLFPLALLWMTLLGGAWNQELVQRLLCGILAADLILILHPNRISQNPDYAALGALGVLFCVALALRLYQIRDLLLPGWLDSYHHTIISTIIRDTGKIPTNYAPYSDIPSFRYHFGFHTYIAFVVWVTGLPTHRAVLVGGQVLNALTVPSLYYGIYLLSEDKRAGLAAALTGSLICRNPAHYVNWGKYPQLMGQTLLPVAIGLIALASSPTQKKVLWKQILLAAFVSAGLALTHYQVAVFLGASGLVWLGGTFACRLEDRKSLYRTTLAFALIVWLALLFSSPWLLKVTRRVSGITTQAQAATSGQQLDRLNLDIILRWGLWPSTLLATGIATIWLLARRSKRRLALGIVTCLALILLVANSPLSSMGFLSNSPVSKALYLPASMLIGLAYADLWDVVIKIPGLFLKKGAGLQKWSKQLLRIGLCCLALAAATLGTARILELGIEPDRHFATEADMRAMRWIENNIPPQSLFLIQGRPWLHLYVANDAAYWLPYVTGHPTLMPPMIYTLEGDSEYVARKTAPLAKIEATTTAKDLRRTMEETGAEYVFLASKPAPNFQHIVKPDLLTAEQYFTLLYADGGARVYALMKEK